MNEIVFLNFRFHGSLIAILLVPAREIFMHQLFPELAIERYESPATPGTIHRLRVREFGIFTI